MRTNIVLDDELVETALREYVNTRKRKKWTKQRNR
jgi:Arc/MetJ family transcription regulator